MWYQTFHAFVENPTPAQSRAVWVCSAVRAVLVVPPSRFTSLKSFV